MRKKSCKNLLRLIKGIAVSVCVRDFPHNPAGNAKSDNPCRNVFCNYTACPDNGVVPYGDAGQNGGACADPYIISDADRLCHLHASLTLLRVNRVLCGGDAAARRDENMITKPNLCPVRDYKIVICVKEIPHKNMIAVIAPEGRGKYHIFAHASQQFFQDFLLTIPVIGTEPVKLIAFLLAFSDFLFQLWIIACLKQAACWNFRSLLNS